MIKHYLHWSPDIDRSAYIDEQATVIGRVTIGAESSVWPQAVLRGDVQAIQLGERSNVQDGAVLHVTHDSHYKPGGTPLMIGDEVTIGHNATLHACTIEDGCLIGMGCIVLDGAVLESGILLAAGSLVPPGKRLESGYLWVGSPAVNKRVLTDEEKTYLRYSARHYVKLAAQHRDGMD